MLPPLRGSSGTPGLAPGNQIFIPEGTWIDRTRSCCSVSEARQGPLSGEAGWRQTILYILSIHVNQGSPHARRRNQTPHRGFRHSGSLQFGAAEHHAVAAFAAQHCADLSMGLRPRLSAAAASRLVWNPRAGARGLSLFKSLPVRSVVILGRAVKPRLAPMATCCRRLRGSMEWGHPVPWAYAHG